MPASTPTERVLNLAAYAHERGSVTLDDIVADVPGYDVAGPLVADTPEWETIRKRLQRDVRDLRDHWGIELTYDTDTSGYVLAPPFFAPEERRALIAAAATVDVVGVDPGVPGAIGSAVDDSTAQIVIRVHALVAALRDAISTRSTVTFGYDGVVRRVQPWALGTWRNRWYVAAFDTGRGELRRFRLDRIDPGTPTIAVDVAGDLAGDGADGAAGGGFTIPDDFDVEQAFDLDPNSWGGDPVLHARVRVARDHLAAFVAELGGKVVEDRGDEVVVALDVREYGSFRTRLLAFGGNAVVLEPPALVEVVVSHLRALAGDT